MADGGEASRNNQFPMARSPPLLCELARHEGRRLKCGANATGTPEHSNDAKVCPPESSVFDRAGESTRQKVAGKWPFRRITKLHNAAAGGKVIVVEDCAGTRLNALN